MSSNQPQSKDKPQQTEQGGDLSLDPEMVKDLEPPDGAGLRGGGIQSSNGTPFCPGTLPLSSKTR